MERFDREREQGKIGDSRAGNDGQVVKRGHQGSVSADCWAKGSSATSGRFRATSLLIAEILARGEISRRKN